MCCDIKYGKGEKKKVKRDLDYVEKMDQMFECMKQQPVDLLSIVKEIQRAVPAAAAPAVAADSAPRRPPLMRSPAVKLLT